MLFWVAIRRLWSDWKKCFYLVAPDTVPRWHRAGFRLYWALLCKVRRRAGRKKIPREVLEKKAVEQGDILFYELAALDGGSLQLLSGQLTLVPVANPLARRLLRREGERNLNRLFRPTDG